MAHLRNELNPTLSNPLRFSLLASLSNVVDMTFNELRDYLGTTDSTLSKHSTALEETGYVHIKKTFAGKRPQTRLSITSSGRQALTHHVDTLNRIAQGQ